MSISRRKFLHAGTLVAISAGVPLKIFADQTLNASNSESGMLSSSAMATSVLNSELFRRHLHTEFLFESGGIKSRLTLNEIHRWDRNSVINASAGRECFSLMFRADDKNCLSQTTYKVSHPALGEFQLFIVPLRKQDASTQYEALFNRLH